MRLYCGRCLERQQAEDRSSGSLSYSGVWRLESVGLSLRRADVIVRSYGGKGSSFLFVANIIYFGVCCWFPFMASLTLTHGVRIIHTDTWKLACVQMHTLVCWVSTCPNFSFSSERCLLPSRSSSAGHCLIVPTHWRLFQSYKKPRQQRSGFLSCSIQRAGNSCVYVMFHRKGVIVNLSRSQSPRTATVGLSGWSHPQHLHRFLIMLALSVVSVAAGFDAGRAAVTFAALT